MEYLIKTKKSIGGMTEEQFFLFCQENETLRFERNSTGEIIVTEPTGTETGSFNSSLTGQLYAWNQKKKLGIIFDSNTGFTLPNTAIRSPDGAFITKERWSKVPLADRKHFAHICPDFVFELRSESDNFDVLKIKMLEWLDNGCRLAWLIDPQERKTTIYREDRSIQVINFENMLNGEDVLPDFTLDLHEIFKEF